MKLTIKEIAQVLGLPESSDERELTTVEFDSRKITEGALFIPLAGERDGHDFVQAAKDNGAIATLWSKKEPVEINGMKVFAVENTLSAFQKLAGYYLKKIGPRVVGITGSNGKTTTKDMTESVLAQKFKTYKTQGNYNNDIGLPYTVFHTPEDCEILILEMGMDRFGEISELTNLAHPEVAAITLIGEAHIENLGSREGIAKAKIEILEGLKKDGLLLIPENEPLLKPLVAGISQTLKTFGEKGEISGKIIEETPTETTFEIAGEEFTIPVLGSYNVNNALIAYGIGKYFGLTIQQIKKGLAEFQLTKNRTQWLHAGNGAKILSDVYNANPTAMGLVLDTVGNLATEGRKLAVLADMLELGPDSSAMHAAMYRHLSSAFSVVFLYGTKMHALAQEVKSNLPEVEVQYFSKEEKPQLIQAIQKELLPTDMIVLKGSNGMGLNEVVEELQKA